jgi:hypothetical protein
MQTALIFLGGALIGGMMVRWLMMHHAHEVDSGYPPAVRAVRRHLGANGTVNVLQAAQLLSIPAERASGYLRQMVRDHQVKFQSHGDTQGFYTLM